MKIKLFTLTLLTLFVSLFGAQAETASQICLANGKISLRAKCPRNSTNVKDISTLLGAKAIHKGTTLRGFYDASMTALTTSGGNNVLYGSISFGGSLSQVPTAHYIAFNETPPAECPGSVEQPEAAEGHLCVYEDGRLNISTANVTVTAGETPVKFGAYVNGTPTTTGYASIRGTWAVTAP